MVLNNEVCGVRGVGEKELLLGVRGEVGGPGDCANAGTRISKIIQYYSEEE